MIILFRLSVWLKQFLSMVCPKCGNRSFYYNDEHPGYNCTECRNFEDEMYLEHGWYSIFTGEYSLKRYNRDPFIFHVYRHISTIKKEVRWRFFRIIYPIKKEVI